jgi:hypothetical protein
MAPGDAVSAPITVTNGGTLDLRYAITATSTNVDAKNLKDQLALTIKVGTSACNNIDWVTDGTTLYTGDLDAAASYGPTVDGKLVGDAASGANTGDRVLPPTTGNTEVLCFHVSLPLATPNSFQAATTTATFTFAAEQTKNN